MPLQVRSFRQTAPGPKYGRASLNFHAQWRRRFYPWGFCLYLIRSLGLGSPERRPQKTARVEIPHVAGWPLTEGAAGSERDSPLSDINWDNVGRLEVTRVYRHGDFPSGGILPDKQFTGTAFEATPIIAEGRMVFTTPYNRVIALDPETGSELWTFDPQIDKDRRFANAMVNRAVTYWHDPTTADDCASGDCPERACPSGFDARRLCHRICFA